MDTRLLVLELFPEKKRGQGLSLWVGYVEKTDVV